MGEVGATAGPAATAPLRAAGSRSRGWELACQAMPPATPAPCPGPRACLQFCPWPQGALTALTSAAVYGVSAALRAELAGRAPRCNEIRIGVVVRRDEEAEHPLLPGRPALPCSRVAAVALGLAAGWQRDCLVRATAAELHS